MIARLVSLVPRNTFCTPAGQIEQQHLMSWHYKNSKSSTLFQYNVEIRIFNVEVFFYLFRMNSAECDGSSLAKKKKRKKKSEVSHQQYYSMSFFFVCLQWCDPTVFSQPHWNCSTWESAAVVVLQNAASVTWNLAEVFTDKSLFIWKNTGCRGG